MTHTVVKRFDMESKVEQIRKEVCNYTKQS
jgi:hypothetical protein